jgi:tRNA (cytidine/uridine-2'-O-)-methyltransferase
MSVEIVLVEPEIPQNTGNIARTCVAVGARLHLVEPLGFRLDDRQVKRAGLDYWFDLDLCVWPDLGALLTDLQRRGIGDTCQFMATTKGRQPYTAITYPDPTVLFFGKETRGLPEALLLAHPERCLRIPMLPGHRSLNLANAVAILTYEVLRQQHFPGMQQNSQNLWQEESS